MSKNVDKYTDTGLKARRKELYDFKILGWGKDQILKALRYYKDYNDRIVSYYSNEDNFKYNQGRTNSLAIANKGKEKVKRLIRLIIDITDASFVQDLDADVLRDVEYYIRKRQKEIKDYVFNKHNDTE